MNNIANVSVVDKSIDGVMPPDFKRRAETIISEYIKSAVLIDDDWPEDVHVPNFDIQNHQVDETQDEEAEEENDDQSDVHAFIEDANGKSIEFIVPNLNSGEENGRRLVAIRNSFVKRGIICTGFKYTAREKANAPLLAKNADILILDWNFAGDSGAGALEILGHLKENGQLRFVCIFTDQKDLLAIKTAIFETLYSGVILSDSKVDFKIGCFVFTLRNKAVPQLDSQFTSSEELLFDDAVTHIAQYYGGFLQLSMLEMTSRHRNTMLSHLTRFSRDFDAAILSDASQHGSPANLAENLRTLLLDEWRIALEESAKKQEMQILGQAGREAYAASLAVNLPSVTREFLFNCISAMGFAVPPDFLEKLFKVSEKEPKTQRRFDIEVGNWLGQGAIGNVKLDAKKSVESKLTLAVFFVLTHLDQKENSLNSAMVWRDVLKLDALFNQQLVLPDEITQGTILKHDDTHYFICITPLCDTVQLPNREGYNSYTFLSAKKINSDDILSKAPDYCVFMEKDNPVCLHVEIKRPFVFEISAKARKLGGIIDSQITARHRLMPIFADSKIEISPSDLGAPSELSATAKEGKVDAVQLATVTSTSQIVTSIGGRTLLEEIKVEDSAHSQLPDDVSAAVPEPKAEINSEQIKESSYSEIIRFTLAGQLRTDFFLMLSAASASNASRVGVNRVEFIRAEKSK